ACAGGLLSVQGLAMGTGPFTYSWSIIVGGQAVALADGANGISIDNTTPGQSILTIDTGVFTVNGSTLTSGSYDVILNVLGACGPASVQGTVALGDCAGHCTLTQGFYGNLKGKFNGTPGVELVAGLLHNDP